MTEHRPLCRFGPGFYRLVLQDGARRFCQTEDEVQLVHSLIPRESVRRVQRDAYCLDGLEDSVGNEATRGVVDAARWLDMPREQGMAELGLSSEADYIRAYRMVEDAVLERDRAEVRTGVRASIVVKKRGTPIADMSLFDG